MEFVNSIDFINSYFSDSDNFFISIMNNQTKQIQNYYHNKNSFKDKFKAIANKNNNASIYFTINSFKDKESCDLNNYGTPKKSKTNVNNIKSIVFDFDEPDTSLDNLEKLLIELGIDPTYILETSPNKYQICFKLNLETINHSEYELINKTLATHFNSDLNVCSVEKLFRLPFFVNRKNGFQTKIITSDFNNVYDYSYFKEFIIKNPNLVEIYNKLLDKVKKPLKKQRKEIYNLGVYIDSNLKDVDVKLIKRYKHLLKINDDDASVTDLVYCKSRAIETNDFDLVFNEILFLRSLLERPLKRDTDRYYKDRGDVFFTHLRS